MSSETIATEAQYKNRMQFRLLLVAACVLCTLSYLWGKTTSKRRGNDVGSVVNYSDDFSVQHGQGKQTQWYRVNAVIQDGKVIYHDPDTTGKEVTVVTFDGGRRIVSGVSP